ncbi:surface-adhesin E family protein [Thermocrinis albus]|nr:surface-adhesin E family protein [Thermocrinis albus]
MMKRVFVLISLAMAILVTVGNVFAQDEPPKPPIPEPSLSPDWSLVVTDFNATLYVNTRRINHLREGIVEAWTLLVPKGEWRRNWVNTLKTFLLLQGNDPNNAEKLWYITSLDKINCKTHQYTTEKFFAYSFGKTVLYSAPSQYNAWKDIVPGSIMEEVEKLVCEKHKDEPPKPPIPEPSLGPEWKLVATNPSVTLYVNTRRINYLPEGIVEVWALFVPRGEWRKTLVNRLKKNLTFKGEDPNNAERLRYVVVLYKINCRTRQYARLEEVVYSFEKTVLYSYSSQYEKWDKIIPGSFAERIEKYVCKKHKEKK